MSNNKQSNFEWLIDKINEHKPKSSIEWYHHAILILGSQKQMDTKEYIEARIYLLDKAKAMHNEEIMEAHFAPKYGCFSEQYYNETFNNQ